MKMIKEVGKKHFVTSSEPRHISVLAGDFPITRLFALRSLRSGLRA